MKKQEGRMRGMRMDQAQSGKLYCADCGGYLGMLYPKQVIAVYLHILCRCGNSGYIEQGSWEADQNPVTADRWPKEICCRDCGASLFSIAEDVRGVALRARCTCGLFMEGDYQRTRRLYSGPERLT